MKLASVFLLSLISALASAAPGDFVRLEHLSDVAATPSLREYDCPAAAQIPKSYDYQAYRITFKTLDLNGREIESRGLLFLPQLSAPLPLFVYQHGTLFGRVELPSNFSVFVDTDASSVGECFASLGYISLLADYLGYGDGTGIHPYIHAESEAWVARDMMRAAQAAFAQLGARWNAKLFLGGYSQGGHAAMALLRLLESDPRREFRVTAAAPMAGPYDISNTVGEVIRNPTPFSATEFAYLLAAYQSIYGFAANLRDVIRSEHLRNVETSFDGSLGWRSVFNRFRIAPADLVRPEFLASEVNNPNSRFQAALRANDLYHWIPRTPLRLFHGGADREVPFSNSQRAFDYMRSNGAPDIGLVNLGTTVDHGAGGPLAFGQAALWFETFP